MNKLLMIIALASLISFSCTDCKKEEQKNESQAVETKETLAVATPDSVIITMTMRGKASRISLLQQKLMHRAKVKLADSLAKLQKVNPDSIATQNNNFEVGLRDIHVIKEGMRYPEKGNKELIEAYITIGVKYREE
ncbi:MAG: hypothetical protein R6U85_09655 [Salinivirgaceae bacterium]